MRKTLLAGLATLSACSHAAAPAYRSKAVTRGSVSQTVNATGDVSALVTVSVGSQVSGIVDKLDQSDHDHDRLDGAREKKTRWTMMDAKRLRRRARPERGI